LSPYFLSIILGIVEGLTEFLPVSSTAHLRITEALMKIPLDDSVLSTACFQDVAYWKMYTIVIQVGAILALCLLFLERIVNFLRTFPKGENGDRNWLTHPISLTLIAFACTSVPALLLRKWSEKNLGSLNAIAIALLAGGIVMWAIDAWSNRVEPSTTHVEEMTLPQAIWIGLCQTLSAVFPGTSRSMSTIAAGQLAGLDRPSALEFSFLLSIPTMIAATGWDLLQGDSHQQGRRRRWRRRRACGHELGALDRAPHRHRGFVHRRPGRGGVVPDVGAQARLHGVRHLPHFAGRCAAYLGRGVSFAAYIRGLVVEDLSHPKAVAGVESIFDLGSSGGSNIARLKHSKIEEAFDFEAADSRRGKS
jgi:undecaprenyl-diphosphatase